MNGNIILDILASVLEMDAAKLAELPPDTALSDLGLTSITFISIIVKVEEAFDIEVLDSDLLLDHFATIEKMMQTLSKYFPGQSSVKKVLVLDADHVLWRGVSGEEELVIDEAVLQFQQFLLNLYRRGVLLCLCSKNEPFLIEEALSNPRMQLKKEQFAVLSASRTDKAEQIRTIAQELNLSPESFVFVDDSDYELGYVSLNLPMVETIKFDFDHLLPLTEKLEKQFAHVHPASDLNRTQLYREQKEREKEKHRFTSVKECNASLQTVVHCAAAELQDCARMAELSERTNQFNLSAKRYTKEELEALITAQNGFVLALSVRDKYGDMGLVGMAVVREHVIEAFMLSCRVFDRDLELEMLEKIKECAGTPLRGVYRSNGKNARYADFYRNNGVETI